MFKRLKWWLRRKTPAYKRQAMEDRGRRAEFYARLHGPQPLPTEYPVTPLPAQIRAAIDKANSYYQVAL